MRNPNPFTPRQLRLLETLRNRLVQITDPDPEIITHESYSWASKVTKNFGTIPTIIFTKNVNRIKAEIIRDAGLSDPDKDHELNKIRKEYGIIERQHKEARLFNAEMDQLMFNLKKHTSAPALINRMFATNQQKISAPIQIIQNAIMTEFKADLGKENVPIHDAEASQEGQNKEQHTSYAQELMEVD